ncbi:hypothetical protein GEMRC1_013981 [Eukaryota sp. GEM-RC1]
MFSTFNSKCGEALLKKFGWKPGDSLNSSSVTSSESTTDASSALSVTPHGNTGLGFDDPASNCQINFMDNVYSKLSSYNVSSSSDSSEPESTQAVQRRRQRYPKRTVNKDISLYTEEALKQIFGNGTKTTNVLIEEDPPVILEDERLVESPIVETIVGAEIKPKGKNPKAVLVAVPNRKILPLR